MSERIPDPSLIERTVEGVRRLVDEELTLEPEERERIEQVLGSWCIERLFDVSAESREDELIDVENYVGSSHPTEEELRQYLITRRAELASAYFEDAEYIKYLSEVKYRGQLQLLQWLEEEAASLDERLLTEPMSADAVVRVAREWIATWRRNIEGERRHALGKDYKSSQEGGDDE